MKRRKAGKISHGLWRTWSHLVRFPGHLSQLHVFHAGFQETPCFISKDRALHSRNHRRSPVGRDPKGTLGPVPAPHSTPSPVSSGVPALPLTARGCAHRPGEQCHAHRPLGHSLALPPRPSPAAAPCRPLSPSLSQSRAQRCPPLPVRSCRRHEASPQPALGPPARGASAAPHTPCPTGPSPSLQPYFGGSLIVLSPSDMMVPKCACSA